MTTRVLKPLLVVLFSALLLAPAVPAAGPASRPDDAGASDKPAAAPVVAGSEQATVRFRAVHVYVDSGDKSLAAYQFDVTATAGDVKLVGLEGGEHPAFNPAPYYDRQALLNNKVIVAAFSTAADLPRGRTRVATLMVQVTGGVEPTYAGKLTAAASADGGPIQAELIVTPVPEGANP